MADIQGTNLAAGIAPFTTEDTFATHYAIYGHGGWREVDTIAERNAIPTDRQSVGMVVYVAADDTSYQLKTDGWVALATSDATYAGLADKPSIAGVTLEGDKSLADLGIQAAGDYVVNADLQTTLADYITSEEIANAYAAKATTLAGYGITDAYTKTEVDAKIASAYIYKGSVDTYASLPTADQTVGDVYNVVDTGKNYAWDGTAWDDLGGIVDLSAYLTSETAAATYATQTALSEAQTTLQASIDLKANDADLATIAKTGSYNDASDKPTIAGVTVEGAKTLADYGIQAAGDFVTTTAFSTELANYITAADIADTYATQTEVNTALALKADATALSAYLTTENAAATYATQDNLTALETTVSGKADKATTLEGYGITDAYTKTEIDSKIASAYIYRGSVASYDALPTEGMVAGDVYNVIDTGKNYAWDGTAWDDLGGTVDLSAYATTEAMNTALALKANSADLATVATTGSYNDLADQPDASGIAYSNGDITSVQEALDQLLYVAPVVNTLTVNGSSSMNYEVGSTVADVALVWTLNKTVTSQSFNQNIGSIDAALRNYTVTGANLTSSSVSSVTYTLTVSDGTNSATKSASVNFRYRRYWGTSANAELTNEEILALSQEFSTSRTQSRTFNCSGGQYFYLVIPTTYCSGISFKVGGLSFSAMEVTTISLVNASGATVSYNVYRPSNLQTGSAIAVEVS